MDEAILVAGATGGVGQQAAHQLIMAGRPVRALVRDLTQASRILDYQAELVEGDAGQPETLRKAVEGVRQVICTIGSRASMGGNPIRVDYEGVRNLAQAARAAGVEHFVLVSSIGATQPDHPTNRFSNVLVWKLRGEEVVRESGLTYSVIRPGGLVDEPGGRMGVRFAQGDTLNGKVTRADVATACIEALTHPSGRNVTFEMVNTEEEEEVDWGRLYEALRGGR
jgi:uncharacterized protein YbjT (DUF2867 family)